MVKPQKILRDFLKDKNEQIVIWQSPNLPLAVWGAATIGSKILVHGKVHQLLTLIAFGTIFTWAWLEIFEGASYFRRVLGLTVLIISIISRIN